MSNFSKEHKTVIILNILSSVLLGMALFLYFGGIAPKGVAVLMALLAIVFDFAQKWVAKTDPKARIFAKAAGLVSIPVLIGLLFF